MYHIVKEDISTSKFYNAIVLVDTLMTGKLGSYSVTLYCRHIITHVDEWKPKRFRHFYLDVSDLPVTQTTTRERTRCYSDHTNYPDFPPNIIEIVCRYTARYVIVETIYDAPDDTHDGAILEICEIEVYGMIIMSGTE